MPIKLGLPFPLVVSRSTPEGDNQVEEQDVGSFLLVNFKGLF